MGRKVRLDKLLVAHGLAPSRQRASELIAAGRVHVDGHPMQKPAAMVDVSRQVTVRGDAHTWVGRGAQKLLGVLEPLGVDPADTVCADLGASTGGFTEVLLHCGAARVYAIDVGRGQLHHRLATDPRVVVMDGVNVRHLPGLPEPIDLVVADLSFISLQQILPAVQRILAPAGRAVLLVKPQFEVGRAHIGSRGRVHDEDARQGAIAAVAARARALGFAVDAGVDSPLPGAKSGNVEHFLALSSAE